MVSLDLGPHTSFAANESLCDATGSSDMYHHFSRIMTASRSHIPYWIREEGIVPMLYELDCYRVSLQEELDENIPHG